MLRSLDPESDFAKPKAAKDMNEGEKDYVMRATKDDETALVNRLARERHQDALRDAMLGDKKGGK